MTADAKRYLAGTPAVVALLGGVVLVAWLWAGSRAGWYAEAADEAFGRADYHTAALCYARLLQAHPTDAATTYNLARSLDATGQADAARTLLLRLAPADAAGYPPAQLRLVKQWLSGNAPTATALADAQRHLDQVLREQPTDPEANFWLAVLCATRGQWDQVAAPTARSGTLRDVLAQRLSRLASAQGNRQRADAWAHDGGR